MKIEILFPELVVLFGEIGNVRYLRRCFRKSEIVETHNGETPAFVSGDVDFVYIGSMAEEYYELAIEALRPYLDDLNRYIEQGKVFLATGNAIDLFGRFIQWGDKKIEGLGLFDYHAVIDRENRHNSWFLGEFKNNQIVSNRSIYSRQYGGEKEMFIKKNGGFGMNDECEFDGVRRNNFYATSLLGPFLITNPLFTEYLIKLIDPAAELWNKETIMEAYNNRLAKFTKPNARFVMGDHG